MSQEVRVTTGDGKTRARVPYNPQFNADAKGILDGRWNRPAKVWAFDARDEERVQELCDDVYGTDGQRMPS